MDKQKKKEIRGHSLQIVIGILLIIPFYDTASWLRFIALAGFLLIMYNLIWFTLRSEEILYDIFPTKYIKEKKTKFKDKIWQHISMFLFFGGLVFLIFRINSIENIIEEFKFWKNFVLLGFVTGVLSLLLINQIRGSVFNESGRRYAVIFGFIIGFMSLSVASASCFNEYYDNSTIHESKFIVERKSTGGKRENTHWIFVEIDNSTKRFKLTSEKWNKIQEEDTVILSVKKGFFDYDYVQNISVINYN